eukprot:11750226-Alexandrium_andersonii.AAC.1
MADPYWQPEPPRSPGHGSLARPALCKGNSARHRAINQMRASLGMYISNQCWLEPNAFRKNAG